MDAFFSTPITTYEEAKLWIDGLVVRGLDFHFEDSPETVYRGMTGGRLFTDDEAVMVRARVEELYGFDFEGDGGCPIGYVLKVTGHEMEE